MKSIQKNDLDILTIDVAPSEYETPLHSSLEIAPKINGRLLTKALDTASRQTSDVCDGYTGEIDSIIPYMEIDSYSCKDAASVFYCNCYDKDDTLATGRRTRCSCWFHWRIARTDSRVVWDKFQQRHYSEAQNKSTEIDLNMPPLFFDKSAYYTEINRLLQTLNNREQKIAFDTPCGTISVKHNSMALPFYVRGKSTWSGVSPDDDPNLKFETTADAAVLIAIPIQNAKAGDSVIVDTSGIQWEYEIGDEFDEEYVGNANGYFFGLSVESYDPYISEVVHFTHELRSNRFVFTINKENTRPFALLSLCWCAKNRKYAKEIATGTI